MMTPTQGGATGGAEIDEKGYSIKDLFFTI